MPGNNVEAMRRNQSRQYEKPDDGERTVGDADGDNVAMINERMATD